jgi:integrase
MSVRTHTWTTKSGEERSAYVVQYSTAELDARGKRKRHVKFFAKKKDATAFEAQVRVDVKKGGHVPDSKSITVAQAGVIWIDACAEVGLERTTIDGYRQHLRDHILPYLGGLKLTSLTKDVVKDWQAKLRNGTPAPDELSGRSVEHVTGPRSADMVKRVTGSLGALLAEAEDGNKVGHNVVRGLRPRRRRGKDRKIERRAKGKLKFGIDIPHAHEIDALLNAAEGRWRPFFLVAVRCGLRASELRGLRWEDIDLTKATLSVVQRADARNEIGNPKTVDGERTVPIPPTTLDALKEWKQNCPKRDGKLHFVFPNGVGNVEYHANIITRGLIPTWMRAGLTAPVLGNDGKPLRDPKGNPMLTAKYTGLHSLRHYFASWCINRRVDGGLELPAKLVSTRLGHATIQITLDLYSHVFKPIDDSASLAAGEGKFG